MQIMNLNTPASGKVNRAETERLVGEVKERLDKGGRPTYVDLVRLVEASYSGLRVNQLIGRVLAETGGFTLSFKVMVGEESYGFLKRLVENPGDLEVEDVAVSDNPVLSGPLRDTFLGVAIRGNGSIEVFLGESWIAGLRSHTYDGDGPPLMIRIVLGDSVARGLPGDTPLIPVKSFLSLVEPGEEVEVNLDITGENQWWALWPSLEGLRTQAHAPESTGLKAKTILGFHMNTVGGVRSLSFTKNMVFIGLSRLPCRCGLTPRVRIKLDSLDYAVRLIEEFIDSSRGEYTIDTTVTDSIAGITVSSKAPLRLEMIGWRVDSSVEKYYYVTPVMKHYSSEPVGYIRVPESELSLDIYTLRKAWITGSIVTGRYGSFLGLAVITRHPKEVSMLVLPVSDSYSRRLLDGKVLVYPSCRGETDNYCLEPVYTSTVAGVLPVYEWSVASASGEASRIPEFFGRILEKVSEELVVVGSGMLKGEADYEESVDLGDGRVFIEKKNGMLEVYYRLDEPVFFGCRKVVMHRGRSDVEYTVGLVQGFHEVWYPGVAKPEKIPVYYPVITLYSPGTLLVKTSSWVAGVDILPMVRRYLEDIRSRIGGWG